MPRPSKWPAVVERVGAERIAEWYRQGDGPAMIANRINIHCGEFVVSDETCRRHLAEIKAMAGES